MLRTKKKTAHCYEKTGAAKSWEVCGSMYISSVQLKKNTEEATKIQENRAAALWDQES